MATKQKLALIGKLAEETKDLTTDQMAERVAFELEILCKKIESNNLEKVELKVKTGRRE